MSARAVQSWKAADFSIVCKVNSLNIALKASLNLGNQWEYRFNEIFNQIFPYCAGFRIFSEIVRDCAALTELCGPAPAHPVRRPVKVWLCIFIPGKYCPGSTGCYKVMFKCQHYRPQILNPLGSLMFLQQLVHSGESSIFEEAGS